MSVRVVIDTSVVFKWFVAYGETGLDEAWELLEEHRRGEGVLVAPALVLAEVANLLRVSGISDDDAHALFDEYERAHVVHFDMTATRVRSALKLGLAHRITVFDATFLALAQELDCPLVTADRCAFGAIPPQVAEIRLVL
jgi:predicted nucleic acid-binding protein